MNEGVSNLVDDIGELGLNEEPFSNGSSEESSDTEDSLGELLALGIDPESEQSSEDEGRRRGRGERGRRG